MFNWFEDRAIVLIADARFMTIWLLRRQSVFGENKEGVAYLR